MKVTQMVLTPEIAEQWLESVDPDKQRKFRDHHALKLARAIERGEWTMNNDMFMHGPDGLGNGQHRCAGVVKSGISVPIVVAWGCTRDEIRRADQGCLKRDTADVLHYEGFTSTRNMAAIINTVVRDLERQRFAPSSEQAVAYCKAHFEALNESGRYWKRACVSRCPVEPSILCAVHYLAKAAGHDCADSFAGKVADCTPDQRGDAVWQLLRRFQENKDKLSGHMSRVLKCALIVKAYNAYRDGKKMPFLRWSPGQGEEFPEIK